MHCNWRWAPGPTPAWCAKAPPARTSAPSSTCRPRSAPWLDEAGFEAGDSLLLRRSIDIQGKSRGLDQRQPGHRHAAARAGRPAGRHPRPARLAEPDPARRRARPARRLRRREHPGAAAAVAALARRPEDAGGRARRAGLAAARTRAPRMADRRGRQAGAGPNEWDELNANHARLSNAQALIDAAQGALQALEGDDGGAAEQPVASVRRCCRARSTSSPHSGSWRGAGLQPGAGRGCRALAARLPAQDRPRSAAPGRTGRAHGLVDVAGAPLQAHAGGAARAAGRLEGGAGQARCGRRPGRAGSRREEGRATPT